MRSNLQVKKRDLKVRHRGSQPSIFVRSFRSFTNNHREFWGIDAIRRWVEKEIVGDKVTMELREVIEHYGDTIVRGAYDGDYDKTNLPPGNLILSNYFTVRNSKIVRLIIIHNRPAA